MQPKASAKVLTILLIAALLCALMLSGPAHIGLHGDANFGDECDACHMTAVGLPSLVLVPAALDATSWTCLAPDECLLESELIPSSAPRAPPLA